jgi:hypothetical protein
MPCQAQSLKGDELTAAVSGKSGTWQSRDGKSKGTIRYDVDGKARITGTFGNFTEDTGVWRISGDKACAKWKQINGGKEACSSAVKRLPDGGLDFGDIVLKLN